MTPRYRWKMLPSQAHIEHQQPNSFPTTCHESKISRKLHNLSSTWILGPLSGPRCASARPDTNQFDKAPRQITCFACDSFFISLVSLSQATTLSCSAILTRDFFAAEKLLNAVFLFFFFFNKIIVVVIFISIYSIIEYVTANCASLSINDY